MSTTRLQQERRFQGIPVSSGVAVARTCLFNENRHNDAPQYRVGVEDVAHEQGRFELAVGTVSDELDQIGERVRREIGKAEAEIFRVQKVILQDEVLIGEIRARIAESFLNAEASVIETFASYEARLREVDNEYLRERVSDLTEIKHRLLDAMRDVRPSFQCSDTDHCRRGRDRVVVAQELSPSLTMDLDTTHVQGFVTERGGPGSHAAILARALQIPAVSGIPQVHRLLACGTELLVDGHTGVVVAWPTEETLEEYETSRMVAEEIPRVVGPVEGALVLANISLAGDVEAAAAMLAEGIGLYRTEYELFSAGRLLSENEQYERYASVIESMRGKIVTFRLLDVGGDKTAPFLGLPEETNPYLGFRGSRVLRARPDLLIPQARALARASKLGPIRILYPFITNVTGLVELREQFDQAVGDIDSTQIQHGVMLEVPSACLEAQALFKHVDFASIGTNDLIQYLYAVDRDNELVAGDYAPDGMAFWRLLDMVAEAAHSAGKPLSVCGELAAEERYIPRFVERGLRRFSVSASAIPVVRAALARLGSGVLNDAG